MPKGAASKRYTPEFKQQAAETMQKERLGCRETARRFEIGDHHRIRDWERILTGPEGFAVEQRGRGGKGRKQIPKEAEVQRLRAEADYLKNL